MLTRGKRIAKCARGFRMAAFVATVFSAGLVAADEAPRLDRFGTEVAGTLGPVAADGGVLLWSEGRALHAGTPTADGVDMWPVSLDLPERPRLVELTGNRAVVAGVQHLYFVEVNPEGLKLIAVDRVTPMHFVTALALSPPYVLAASGRGLSRWELETGEHDSGFRPMGWDHCNSVDVGPAGIGVGTYSGFHLLDPEDGTVVGGLTENDGVTNVTMVVMGPDLAILMHYGGADVVDMVDPSAPVLAAVGVPGLTSGFAAYGQFVEPRVAVVVDWYGMQLVDLSDPAVPTVERVEGLSAIRGLTTDQGRVFVSEYYGIVGLDQVGGAALGTPQLLLPLQMGYRALPTIELQRDGTALAVKEFPHSLIVLRTDDRGHLVEEQQLSLSLGDADLAVGPKMIVAAGWGGLLPIRIDEEGRFVEDDVAVSGVRAPVMLRGDLAWVATAEPGLVAVDLTCANEPVVLGTTRIRRCGRVPCGNARTDPPWTGSGTAKELVADDRVAAILVSWHIAISSAEYRLHFVDITNTSRPFEVFSMETHGFRHHLVLDDLGLLEVRWDTMVRFSLADPSNPQIVAEAELERSLLEVKPFGNGYIALRDHDIDNPPSHPLAWIDRETLAITPVELVTPSCERVEDIAAAEPFVLLECRDDALELYRKLDDDWIRLDHGQLSRD